jgi:hypothetical protein
MSLYKYKNGVMTKYLVSQAAQGCIVFELLILYNKNIKDSLLKSIVSKQFNKRMILQDKFVRLRFVDIGNQNVVS